MEKVQKNLIRTYSFTFGDDALVYKKTQKGRENNIFLTYKEPSTETEKTISYADIPMGKIVTIKAPLRVYKTLAGIFLGIAAVLIMVSFFGTATACIFISMALFYMHMKWTLNYTNYIHDDGKTILSVIEDKESKTIQEEIKTRFIAAAKTKYGFVDLTRTADEERTKMLWLKSLDVISEAEYKGFLDQIKNAFPGSA